MQLFQGKYLVFEVLKMYQYKYYEHWTFLSLEKQNYKTYIIKVSTK